jgi:hypothetical protein
MLRLEHIQKMLAAIETRHAKRNWLKAIRAMMRFAVSVGMRADDPTEGIKNAKLPRSDGHHHMDG